MLELKDFLHLPQLEPLFERLAASPSGLIVIAGLDPRQPQGVEGFLPSGRAALFRILMRQMMEARPSGRALVVSTDKEVVRLPRQFKDQVDFALVNSLFSYESAIKMAAGGDPGLLVIDQLDQETAGPALAAASQGVPVLSQLDTVFCGADVARSLIELGADPQHLWALRWVVAVQRLPMLCTHCRRPLTTVPPALSPRLLRYPDLAADDLSTFYQPGSCQKCQDSGRQGEVMAFDVFCMPDRPDSLTALPSQLPLEEYVLRLAAAGHLAADDALGLETDQLRRTYNLLTASEHALQRANRALEAKLLELETANRVLQQRTKALLSLQEMGQALLSSMSLQGLAQHICSHARNLCDADRAVLYYFRSPETAEILGSIGWDVPQMSHHVDTSQLLLDTPDPIPFDGPPPGIDLQTQRPQLRAWRAALHVPLTAQGQPVGAMLVHTRQSASFVPGKVALLQSFANQAALAIQRTGLTESLQRHIEQLQEAQAELVKKERLEQELELARQVQQSMLPRIFPMVPGYTFAATNRPARHVGGDFYDVFLLDANLVGIVVGDVSDKGLPSALYMALTRSLLFAEARRERSPAQVLQNVHRLLLALGEANMFVTIFYGVIDVSARRLTYARAGHDYPLLLRQGGVQTLGGEGTILGFPGLDDLGLTEEEMALQPADRLLLYTDGLTDVIDESGRLFSLQRLIPIIQRHAELSLDELCAAVFADLEAYQGDAPQNDDMTILVVEVK